MLFFAFTLPVFAQDAPSDGYSEDPSVVSAGEALFKGNCAQCHAINEVVIGPALKNVHERRPKEWLLAWIKNSQKVIQSGDEYAVALYNEYKKNAMPAYPFTDDQISSIVSYIKVESTKAPVVVVDTTVSGGDSTAQSDSVSSSYITAVLIVLVVVLILMLVVLGLVINVLTKYLRQKSDLDDADSEVVNQQFSLRKLASSNGFIGLVVFVVTALVLKTLIDGAFTIGVQQGYQPTQPIAFSHAIHAGKFEIDCQYCHTGVRKGKSASIPSPNICMNCHSAIKTESPEIQKIYAAIDYNPTTGEYGTNVKPIEWVRIHNLPDLAYFNHSQHVNVGGLECETCHGPIQEMDVVYQYSPLTMGWCINCHRETEVNTKDNEYYTRLVELHSQHSKEPLKVEDIGGLECSKCHY